MWSIESTRVVPRKVKLPVPEGREVFIFFRHPNPLPG